MNIIKRIIENSKRAWDSKLKLALWADRVTEEINWVFTI